MTNNLIFDSINFYKSNKKNVDNYGLGHLTESADRVMYNRGKKLATATKDIVAKAITPPLAGVGTAAYSKVHDWAGQTAIEYRIQQGETVIYLDDLYEDVDANDDRSQTGVRWAVRRAKDAGILAKTSTQGKYQVV